MISLSNFAYNVLTYNQITEYDLEKDIFKVMDILLGLNELCKVWKSHNSVNSPQAERIISALSRLSKYGDQLSEYITASSPPVEISIEPEQVINKRLAPVIRKLDEWKQLKKLIKSYKLSLQDKNLTLSAIEKLFISELNSFILNME